MKWYMVKEKWECRCVRLWSIACDIFLLKFITFGSHTVANSCTIQGMTPAKLIWGWYNVNVLCHVYNVLISYTRPNILCQWYGKMIL